jgi:hypothetical protein
MVTGYLPAAVGARTPGAVGAAESVGILDDGAHSGPLRIQFRHPPGAGYDT